jgi:hypothetical protein
MPIVVGAGRVPRWGRNGTRLFYTTPADRYIVALMPALVAGAQAENHVTLVRGLRDELLRKVP